MTSTLLWAGLGMQEPVLVVFVKTVLAGSDASYAYVTSVASLGALVGAVIAGPLARTRTAAVHSYAWSITLAGLIFGVFAGSQEITAAGALLFAGNAAYGVANVIDEFLEQELAPQHVRARIISLIGAIATGGYLIGGALVGCTVELLGARWSALISAGLITGAGFIASCTMPARIKVLA
ncbi:hypothetical protein KIMH_08040 [Bombiscardovia apis]|uniref:Major facilitator superfamily (MFS) profile domain-containing protein n=1 Tax=Bombiscardovia apis TaxID=2932182 RepID=A0ABN6SHH0_9BIFI|nr:hypothetical protein KIMH_08040 [Bombiscardovia apis]